MDGLGTNSDLITIGVIGIVVSLFIFLLIFAYLKAKRAKLREVENQDQEEASLESDAASSPPPAQVLDAKQPEPAADPDKKPEPSHSASALAEPAPLPTVVETKAEREAASASKPNKSELSLGLAKTRSGWIARLGQVFAGKREIDPALLSEIERTLLTADIGVKTSQSLIDEIKTSLGKKEIASPESVWSFLKSRSRQLLSLESSPIDFKAHKPFVLLVIGVNGSGKTTTIGKLAAQLTSQGNKVLLVAGDTFRAAATEQLEIWGQRSNSTVVKGKEGADPSSVLFEGIKRGLAEGADVVIGDTAGRLHTKANLMEELQKAKRVMDKACPGAPHETWLVIDSTSGQNAIAQAQIFAESMSVTGVVLTKLDGTAKGGVILGIADQLKIPVRYIGVGEKTEDLRPFDADDFVEALFEDTSIGGQN